MNGTPVVISFTSLIRPSLESFRAGLEPYADWQPENFDHIPVMLEWPEEVRNRLDYLRALLAGRIAWPPGVSSEAQRQVRSLVEEIVERIKGEIIAGARLILSVGDLGGSRRGELTGAETTDLLDLYIASKTMTLVRLLLAFRLRCPSDPQWREKFYHLHADPDWMRRFYHLHVNWGEDAIDGLPYVNHDRGDEALYWTDADAYQEGVISGGTRYRVYEPGTLDLRNGNHRIARNKFLRYIAPQLVEQLARSDAGGADLAAWARTPAGWRVTERHGQFIELISFHEGSWSNFQHGHASPDGESIHQHVLRRLRTLVDQSLFGPDTTEGRFEELANRFRVRFPLRRAMATETE